MALTAATDLNAAKFFVNKVTSATGTATTTAVAPTYIAGPPANCSGVVTGVNYTFTHSSLDDYGEVQLVLVNATLTVADAILQPGATAVVVTQAFSVTWLPQDAEDASLLQTFSGHPGYQPGFPVLAGVVTKDPSSSKQAVSRFKAGLSLPVPGVNGLCEPNGTAMNAIGFGYNVSNSCSTVGMTLSDFKDSCLGITDTLTGLLEKYLGPPYLTDINGSKIAVGVWGNSDYTNVDNEWVILKPSKDPRALSWDETRGSCANVLSGFDITFYTGVTYATNNLQSKILRAQVCFSYSTWEFDLSADATVPQSFRMQFTASFVAQAQPAPTTVVKPTPPLAAPLPPDLFYPFLPSTSGVVSTQPSNIALSGALLLTLWLLLAGL